MVVAELDDAAWEAEREAICQHVLGVPAAEFVARFRDGRYPDPDGPELD